MSRELPPKANLEHLKKQSKDLLKAHQSGDVETCQRIGTFLPRLSKASEKEIRATKVTLQEVQYVIAREYGFDKWAHIVTKINRSSEEEAEKVDTVGVPAAVIDRLKRKLEGENPRNYQLQLGNLKVQIRAYKEFNQFTDEGVPKEVLEELKGELAAENPDDYQLQLGYLKVQIRAYKELQTVVGENTE